MNIVSNLLEICVFCKGNGCLDCNQKGRVIIPEEVLITKIKKNINYYDYLTTNKDNYIINNCNIYEDINDSDILTDSAIKRLTHEWEVERTETMGCIGELASIINFYSRCENQIKSDGYIEGNNHLDICRRCTKEFTEDCKGCINNMEVLFIEDCDMLFEAKKSNDEEWYSEKGYKLGVY